MEYTEVDRSSEVARFPPSIYSLISSCVSTSDLIKENLRIFNIFRFIKASAPFTDCRLDIDKELFIWSVITGRRNFNLLFWARGKNKICK